MYNIAVVIACLAIAEAADSAWFVQNFYSDAACTQFAGQTSVILNSCVQVVDNQYAIFSAEVDSATSTYTNTATLYSDSGCTAQVSATPYTGSTACAARNNGYVTILPVQATMPTSYSANGGIFTLYPLSDSDCSGGFTPVVYVTFGVYGAGVCLPGFNGNFLESVDCQTAFISGSSSCAIGSNNPTSAGTCNTELYSTELSLVGNLVATCYHPYGSPSATPSAAPSNVTSDSVVPSVAPSVAPSITPTIEPSATPSTVPTFVPSLSTTVAPSATPSAVPSIIPTNFPSASPASSAWFVQNFYSDAACTQFAGQTSVILNSCVQVVDNQYAIFSAEVDSATSTYTNTATLYSDSGCTAQVSATPYTGSTACAARNNGYVTILPVQATMPTSYSANGGIFTLYPLSDSDCSGGFTPVVYVTFGVYGAGVCLPGFNGNFLESVDCQTAFISGSSSCAIGSNNPTSAGTCDAGLYSTELSLVGNLVATCYHPYGSPSATPSAAPSSVTSDSVVPSTTPSSVPSIAPSVTPSVSPAALTSAWFVQNFYSDAACTQFAGQTSVILNSCVQVVDNQYAIFSAEVDSATSTYTNTATLYSDSGCTAQVSATPYTGSTACAARNNGYVTILPVQATMPTTYSANGGVYMLFPAANTDCSGGASEAVYATFGVYGAGVCLPGFNNNFMESVSCETVFISGMSTCSLGSNNPSDSGTCNAGVSSTELGLWGNAASSCYSTSTNSNGSGSGSTTTNAVIGGVVGGAAFLAIGALVYWKFFLVKADPLLGRASKATDVHDKI